MDHNTKSVRIETPVDINEEVRSILTAARKKQPPQSEHPRTPKKLRISTATSAATRDSSPLPQNTIAKFITSQSYDLCDLPRVTTPERQERPRTPVYPEVQLLNNARPAADVKPIGFRPTWKCEA